MTDHAPAPSKYQALLWPGIVFWLMGISFVIMGITVYMASTDTALAIVPDYYEKGLRWDEIKAERARSDTTGWSHAVQAAPAGAGWTLTVRLVDAAGGVIDNADVSLRIFPATNSKDVRELEPAPIGRGGYEAELRGLSAGVWKYELVARRGEQDVLIASGSCEAYGG